MYLNIHCDGLRKTVVILSVLWLTQADTDYDRQPFGRQMCEKLCENIRGCRVYMFTMVDFSCHVTNIKVREVSKENRKFVHSISEGPKPGRKCEKHSRVFTSRKKDMLCEENNSGCPGGYTWIKDAKVCYDATQRSYKEAEQTCAQGDVKGRLAILDTVSKFKRLREFLRSHTSLRCCWVGAKRQGSGGFPHWNDGSEINRGFWGSNEPSNEYERCANMLYKYDYKLNDDFCGFLKCSYACDFFV